MRRLGPILALVLCACPDAGTSDLIGQDGSVWPPPDGGQVAPRRDGGSSRPRDGGRRDAGTHDAGSLMCQTPPDCDGCADDGECCYFSLNCRPESRCNVPDDPAYDPSHPDDVCVRGCASNADCTPGSYCDSTGRCLPRPCQGQHQCGIRELCVGGECVPTGGVPEVVACAVVPTHAVTTTGRRVRAPVVGYDASGRGVPFAGLIWTSSDRMVASVAAGSLIEGGAVAGTATITVTHGAVVCDGALLVTNHAPLTGQQIRVVVVDARTEAPVAGANVTLVAGGPTVASTDARGAAMFIQGIVAPTSVTVSAPGYAVVSVLEPPVDDLVVALPPIAQTSAAGFRGTVDVSASRASDMKVALTSASLSSDMLTLGRFPFGGAPEPIQINAPELGFDGIYSMPAGLSMALGTSDLTGGPDRCYGIPVPPGSVGCHLARGRHGAGAGWALGGQLRLSQVTALANELSAIMEGEPVPPSALLAIARLGSGLRHGVAPFVPFTPTPNVPRGVSVDCSDPDLADYADVCRPDFGAWPRFDVEAAQPQNVYATIDAPGLPLTSGTACADTLTLMAATRLPGRGIVPLGFGVGFDTLDETGTPDCVVEGAEQPFGPTSPPLDDGEIALISATRHHGLEAGDLMLIGIARDTDGDRYGRSVRRRIVADIGNRTTLNGVLMARPDAELSVPSARLAFITNAGHRTRTEIFGDGSAWIVYAPAFPKEVTLPDVPAGRAVLASMQGAIFAQIEMERNITEPFDLAAPVHAHHTIDYVTAFATSSCVRNPADTCAAP